MIQLLEIIGSAGFLGLELFGVVLFGGVLWAVLLPRNRP